MAKYILREEVLSHPFANGKYDHKNADINFILGYESYKEWLETLPVFTEQDIVKSYLEKLKSEIEKIPTTTPIMYGNCTRGYKIEHPREIKRKVINIIDNLLSESEDKDGNNNQHN